MLQLLPTSPAGDLQAVACVSPCTPPGRLAAVAEPPPLRRAHRLPLPAVPLNVLAALHGGHMPVSCWLDDELSSTAESAAPAPAALLRAHAWLDEVVAQRSGGA